MPAPRPTSPPGPDLRHLAIAITGGARGIGRATAQTLARRGARIAIGDLDEIRAQAAADDLGGDALGVGLDVTDRASFNGFLDRIEQTFGTVDVLVNNAGIQHVGPFVGEDRAATAAQVAVNLSGVLTGTQLALARMLPRQRGHIVNLASVAGKIASPGGATYAATKHAVVGLSESLRGELRGSGIAVSIILPAIIATEMTDGLGSARGVKPVPPQAVAEAIARAVARGRGVDVYVPGSVGTLIALRGMLPRRVSDLVQRAVKADDVLTKVDRAARADYQARLDRAGPGAPVEE